MTDRELSELAAKAYGINVEWEEVHQCLWISMNQGVPIEVWNPLEDDGAALRLAVKLEMHITSSKADAWASTPEVDAIQPIEGNPLHATRRAIVRAAAALQLFKEAQ